MARLSTLLVAATAAIATLPLAAAWSSHGCTTSTDFNYLELVLQYPVTSCKTSSCNATDAYFTLHGAARCA